MDFVKKHYKKIIGIIVICLILIVAYWYGGDAPGSRGFVSSTSSEETTTTEKAAGTYGDEVSLNSATETTTETTTTEVATTEEVTTTETTTTETVTTEATTTEAAITTETVTAETTTTEITTTETTTTEETAKSDETTESTDKTTEDTNSKNTPSEDVTPKSEETGETSEEATEVYTCTISISCKNILNNMELLDESKTSCVPSNGWILKSTEVEFEEGETVFDILQKVTKEKNIHLEYSYSAIYGSTYIEGINNIYEFDCGELSGWEYSVNGSFPGYGSSKYVLSDGDVIAWVYTCDLGADVGNAY